MKQITPDENAAFKIKFKEKEYSVVSAVRSSSAGIATSICSLLLFNEAGVLTSAVDVLGTDNIRPWTCDGAAALSFTNESNGNIRIVSLYDGVAPSSEPFRLPVVLQLDFSQSSLTVDEGLTSHLSGKNIRTIKAARARLKQQ